MSKRAWYLGLWGVIGMGAPVVGAGCGSLPDDCHLTLTCKVDDAGAPPHDSGPPPACIPSESGGVVADSCGVFVSPAGSDTNPGTKAKPLKTLGAAVKKGAVIYACASATPFEEALVIDKAVTLFGGMACEKGWAYDPTKKTRLEAGADEVPLRLESTATGSAVSDFAIMAANAVKDGGSSIAVLVDGAALVVERSDLTAGTGASGAAGEKPTGSGQAGAPAPAPSPTTSLDGCVDSQAGVLGGTPGQMTCGTIETSGGAGGMGLSQSSGGTGTPGNPQPQDSATPGHDGMGGKAQGAKPCDDGNPGADGLPGAQPGAGATGLGDLAAAGYQGPAATPGQAPGSHGYGGGGGGGAKKCTINSGAGPAGGGGGAGGCGGLPGGAGQSAGSSFGIVAVSANVTLNAVTITVANGGAGGVGGDGQPGGQGGSGGIGGSSNNDGTVKACKGGDGGQGGRGSSGGGGLGGHSAGVAFKGKAPAATKVTIAHGQGGAGGSGGDKDSTTPGIVGGPGLACTTLDFTDPSSPSACVK